LAIIVALLVVSATLSASRARQDPRGGRRRWAASTGSLWVITHNELVAGFHRVAAARSLGLTAVPVVVRDAVTEDADRAVENITSCRRRHDVIYANGVVMPRSESRCPTFVVNPLARSA
jgi:hypothetical protein